jgi:putative oxidoreductase
MATGIPLLVARILLSAMFLSSGYAALSDITGTADYFTGLGLGPGPLLAWGVGVFELVAGGLVLIGFLTRPTAVVLALFTLAATYLGHFGQGGDDAAAAFVHNQALLKDLAVAGGMILLAIQGPGRISLDRWRAAGGNS